MARSSPQCPVLSWLFKCGPWATYHLLTLPASRPVRRRRLSGHLTPQSWGVQRARTEDLASGSSEPVRARGGGRSQASGQSRQESQASALHGAWVCPLVWEMGTPAPEASQAASSTRALPPPASASPQGPCSLWAAASGRHTRRPCLDSRLHPSRVHRQQEDGPPSGGKLHPHTGPGLGLLTAASTAQSSVVDHRPGQGF